MAKCFLVSLQNVLKFLQSQMFLIQIHLPSNYWYEILHNNVIMPIPNISVQTTCKTYDYNMPNDHDGQMVPFISSIIVLINSR